MSATTTTPQWTWADRTRKVRRDAGLSQAEFAIRLGVSRQVIAQWEAGNHEPRELIATALRIESYFGVPAAWMLGLLDGEAPVPAGPVPADVASSGCFSNVIPLPVPTWANITPIPERPYGYDNHHFFRTPRRSTPTRVLPRHSHQPALCPGQVPARRGA